MCSLMVWEGGHGAKEYWGRNIRLSSVWIWAQTLWTVLTKFNFLIYKWKPKEESATLQPEISGLPIFHSFRNCINRSEIIKIRKKKDTLKQNHRWWLWTISKKWQWIVYTYWEIWKWLAYWRKRFCSVFPYYSNDGQDHH